MSNPAEACGLISTHIDVTTFERPVHQLMVPDLQELKQAAGGAGFELAIASGFRSFDRQLWIWNAKALGEKPIMDAQGQVLCLEGLSDEEKMWAILRWSALPGASRHHFGTELDIYDGRAVPPDYELQLTVAEARNLFGDLHAWLDSHLAQPGCRFFRPYVLPDFGVAPEPWHLSFAPLATGYQQCVTLKVLTEVIEGAEIELKASILANLPVIYQHYVQVPWLLYPQPVSPSEVG